MRLSHLLTFYYLISFHFIFSFIIQRGQAKAIQPFPNFVPSDLTQIDQQGKRNEFLASFYNSKWKSKPKSQFQAKQDDGQGILTPGNGVSDLLPSILPPLEPNDSYLPNLGFWADLSGLVTRDFPASPFVKLGRDLFESEQCAQFVSCETSRFSRRHDSLNWIHEFLVDFPFQGDLADRLKDGSLDSLRTDKCGFNCNPLGTLRRGLKTLSLLHEVVRAAN